MLVPFSQALQKKAVNVDQVLRYLVKSPVTNDTVLAYSATCKYVHPNEHYIDKTRFLTVQSDPQYQMVYAYVTGTVDYT